MSINSMGTATPEQELGSQRSVVLVLEGRLLVGLHISAQHVLDSLRNLVHRLARVATVQVANRALGRVVGSLLHLCSMLFVGAATKQECRQLIDFGSVGLVVRNRVNALLRIARTTGRARLLRLATVQVHDCLVHSLARVATVQVANHALSRVVGGLGDAHGSGIAAKEESNHLALGIVGSWLGAATKQG